MKEEKQMRINQEVTTAQDRIAELAKRYQGQALTSIHHLMDLKLLCESYWKLDGSKSPGVDGQTKADYGEGDNLARKLEDLLTKVRRKEYRAPPVKRVEIPKGPGGETRPIGIPTTEDKVLQKAFVSLVEPVFEQEFHDFSYGFRPGKSQHQALKELSGKLVWEGGYVIDLDLRKFFDSIPKGKLQEAFRKRIKDGVLNQLLVGWLNAGIMKNGHWEATNAGTPQGGNVSPLLSNLYLHDVLDSWFVEEVQPRLKGGSGMVRFADDAVLYFEKQEDAEKVLEVLPKRLGKYGLSLHPEKTKLLDFTKPKSKGERKPTFDFLGFTYYWGETLKGRAIVKLKTARKKLTAKLNDLYDWCKTNRHLPMGEQREILTSKLRGHYQYYGVSHNSRSLSNYYHRVVRIWHKWLNRRGGKAMSYEKLNRYLRNFPLPRPKIVHAFF
jgi:group II intron reverse transcriptase/maturase